METINHKNDVIKKEIDKLTKKKTTLDPDNDFKEYTVELLKKLDYEEDKWICFCINNLKKKGKNYQNNWILFLYYS